MAGNHNSRYFVLIVALLFIIIFPFHKAFPGGLGISHIGSILPNGYLALQYAHKENKGAEPYPVFESGSPECLMRTERVTGQSIDAPFKKNIGLPGIFRPVPVKRLEVLIRSAKNFQTLQDTSFITMADARAKPYNHPPEHDLELLIGVDAGYWVFYIVETTPSGKPVAVRKVNTGQYYFALEYQSLWQWLNDLSSIRIKSKCNEWQKLLYEFRFASNAEPDPTRLALFKKQLMELVHSIIMTPPQNTDNSKADKKPVLYSLPKTPPSSSSPQPDSDDQPSTSGATGQEGTSSGFHKKPLSRCDQELEDALHLLGLEMDALKQPDAAEVIKSHFRKAARKYHPDKGGTHEQFLKLKSAAECLGNHLGHRGLISIVDDITDLLRDYEKQSNKVFDSMHERLDKMRSDVKELSNWMNSLHPEPSHNDHPRSKKARR